MRWIDENTKISIGFALGIVGGGAVWITNIDSQTVANAKSLEIIQVRQIEYTKAIQNIEKDTAVIKTRLEWLIEGRKNGSKF